MGESVIKIKTRKRDKKKTAQRVCVIGQRKHAFAEHGSREKKEKQKKQNASL